jgi:gamma-glutamyltranspeptidase/glutathione hydrolase
MLNILEPFDLAAAGYGSADAWHPMLEAMKLAFADRSRFLGDPDFVDVPAAWLTGRAHADSQRALMAAGSVIDPGSLAGEAAPAESQHTTHFSIVDAEGNAVAATLTINLGFGSGMIAAGTGVILNDEMDDFAAAPGTPNAFGLVQGERNAVGAGRRPLSSMTPTIVLKDGAVFMVTGSPGGSRIITSTLQTILHVVDFDMDARQAAAAPRVHHQWSPAHGWYEHYGMAPEVRRDLARRGHDLRPRGAMGNVQIIVRNGDGWTGASDPRGVGLAAGF